MCKLDIEKAYNHVDWSFLCSVLKSMDFGRKWIEWIRWCISTISFSMLVNGTPLGFLGVLEGLDKGTLFPLFCLLL